MIYKPAFYASFRCFRRKGSNVGLGTEYYISTLETDEFTIKDVLQQLYYP
jgi:hypothetical protein